MKFAAVVVVPLTAALTVDALAEWPTDPSVNLPICTAAYGQGGAQVISDGAGGTIIVWSDPRTNGSDWRIYAQRVNQAGEIQWTHDGVTLAERIGNQGSPTLVPDGAGGAIVSWQDDRAGPVRLYGQRVSGQGIALWDPAGIRLCTALTVQDQQQMVSDGAGGAIVTWCENSAYIYAQRVSGSGSLLWLPRGVGIYTGIGASYSPVIAPDGVGGAIIAWGKNYDLYAQRVDAAGATLWTKNGVAVCTAPDYQQSYSVAPDGAGGAIVSWADLRSTFFRTYAQRVNAAGLPQWTADGVALGDNAAEQREPCIASDGTGGAIVSWHEDEPNHPWRLVAQRLDAGGTRLWSAHGADVWITASRSDAISYPAIASDSAGGAVVAWAGPHIGSDWQIYAQRLNASGAPLWVAGGLAICTAPGQQGVPSLASDGAGSAVIIWQDNRSTGDNDLYAQRVDRWGRLGSGPPTLAVTATAGPGGSIAPSGIVPVAAGENRTFAFSPNASFRVFDVRVDDVSVGAPGSYTFVNIQSDHTITASFSDHAQIVASAGPGGSITPSGVVSVLFGSSQTFLFSPDSAFRVLDVRVDGISVGSPASYTLANVQTDHTISVTFAAIEYLHIVAFADTGGAIVPQGDIPVPRGGTQTFTVVSGPYHAILEVLVDDVPVGPRRSYTFTNVQADHRIEARFTLFPAPILGGRWTLACLLVALAMAGLAALNRGTEPRRA